MQYSLEVYENIWESESIMISGIRQYAKEIETMVVINKSTTLLSFARELWKSRRP
jgi:hypothetical protein